MEKLINDNQLSEFMNAVLDGLLDKKVKNILTVLIRNKDELFHLQKISKLSNVPIASSFRIVKRLASLGFIAVIRINKFKVYKLGDNKKTKELIGLLGK